MFKPIVNIITRTSNRPKGFKKLRDSIEAQTYLNIRHIVLYDDESALDYLSMSEGYITARIDKEEVLRRNRGINPNTGPYFPYNYYLNDAYDLCPRGYVYILDDDDYLADEHVIEDLVERAKEDRLIIAKMQMADGTIIPENKYFGSAPRISHIGGGCVFFHTSFIEFAKWDCWKCSDFRVINRLYHSVNDVLFYSRIIKIKGNNGGLGKKQDIK